MDGTVRVRSLAWFACGVVAALVATLIVTQAWRVDAAPGDSDATFVPITPCRLADTRPAPNRVGTTATFGTDETVTFDAHGSNGECVIPTEAVGLSLNVTALGATLPTFITVWPDGTRPKASSLNPAPGAPPVPNAVVTPLAGAGSLKVYNLQGSVDVIIDVNGYYTSSSLSELAARLTAAEANIAANTAGVAANTAGVAVLEAAQPFTIASEPISFVDALSTASEIRSVTVQAPVTGHVAVVASGYILESSDGQTVECGLLDSVTEPPQNIEVRWQSPTGGDRSHLSASRVFDITAGATATYYLVCLNTSGGSATIFSPQVTAIFTPAP